VINTEEFYYKSADGLNLYCRVYASAQQQNPTVLCLPGLTRNSRDFAVLAAHLATRYRVLTPDLRGRGRSDHDPHWQNYHPGTYLADIRALLQAQPNGRIAVIGTSLGALLAMALAAERPEAVAGIVLNDAGPEIDPAGLARIAQYVGKQAPVNSWSEAVAYTRAVYGEALPGLSEEQWQTHTRRGYREDAHGRPVIDMDLMIGAALRAAAPATDLWPLYRRLQPTPILVIRGAMSDILSAATVQRMAQEKPDLQQLTIANRGHAPLLDEPGCIPAIDRFLDDLTF
jgi:pimeloyl-ACP methyl ester carboxylesterase